MSLETFIDGKVQSFRKDGAGNLRFGLEDSTTFKLLPLFRANESGSSASITEITAVKIDPIGIFSNGLFTFKELGRVVLPTNLIIFDSASNQYIIDNTKTITGLLEECIYYLEFKNGFNVFETEAFLVKIMDYPITWDLTIITFDSTLITFDQTNITI